MKKRVLTLILMGCMVLSLAACAKKEEPKENETEQAGEDTKDDENSALGTSKLTKLGEYKGVSYTPLSLEVTDEELEAEVQRIVKGSTVKKSQKIVTEASTVNIDYEGKKDGIAFEGGTAAGQELNITNSGYIPGFAESIVGMKPGETKDCPMTFPEDYHQKDLAGADVVFTITLNDCWENVPAELNDEFAQSQDCENVAEFYVKVRENYEAAKKDQAAYKKQYDILKAVIDDSEFEINDEETALLEEQIRTQRENMAYMYYGVDLETYVAGMGMTMAEFEAECEETALFRIQTDLLKDAIAEKENIDVSDEEYSEGVQQYVSEYGYADQAQFEEAMGKENILDQLLYDKIVSFLEENAVSTEE